MKFAAAILALGLAATPALAQDKPHNIIIFVADGLRYGSVTKENMPNMFRLKTEGVDFTNSHSLFPTITTVNASAIATGHYIGDTGNFGNVIWTGTPMLTANGAPTAMFEDDAVLAEMNQKFAGNYLNEDTLIARARKQGFNTAIIGKVGPTRIQDSTAAPDSSQTLIVDENTGRDGGFGLPAWFTREMKAAVLGPQSPKTSLPDYDQENWQMRAVSRIVLPHFAESGKPFAMLFWSRDPDITQHNATESVGEYQPGINGITALAATRHADSQLGALLKALKEEGLDKTTDVFVTADHGFLTISHASATSPSAHMDPNAPLTDLPLGFLAVDIASTLHLRLFDPTKNFASVDYGGGARLAGVAGMIGDPNDPQAVVVVNGGTDLIYLPKDNARQLAGDIMQFLTTQDYVSGIFVNDRLGKIPGALPMSALNLIGSASTPQPSIMVSFRSFSQPCNDTEHPLQCTVGVHDTPLKTGQGSHGSLSRAETRNFMAAIGPDFKQGYADKAPISNADIAPTLARAAGITLAPRGKLRGRVIAEALVGGSEPQVSRRTLASDPAGDVRTLLNVQQVGDAVYFDAGGFAGKTVGLTPP